MPGYVSIHSSLAEACAKQISSFAAQQLYYLNQGDAHFAAVCTAQQANAQSGLVHLTLQACELENLRRKLQELNNPFHKRSTI